MRSTLAILVLFLFNQCGSSKKKDQTYFTELSSDSTKSINDSIIETPSQQSVYHLNKKFYSNKPIDYPKNYFRDSVTLENKVRFDKIDYGQGTEVEDGAIYTLKITNKGHFPIPDFESARGGFLKIIVNGDSTSFFMTLANHAVSIDEKGHIIINYLEKDSSDVSFDLDFKANEESFTFYGQKITCQWKYMGHKTEIIEADLINKKSRTVKNHIPKKSEK